MAYTSLTVFEPDIDGDETLALMVLASTQGADGFKFVNDGKTILYVIDDVTSGAGDTVTFEANYDKYGHKESPLTRTVTAKKSYMYGPFRPELWNDYEGKVRFAFTTGAVTTSLIAVRVDKAQ